MRAVIHILVALLILLAIAGGVGLYLLRQGFSAREQPSSLEEFFARHARRIATPAGARELKSPLESTEADLAVAREHWVDHCALCHGLDGTGNTDLGRNLYPPAPDLRDPQTRELSDGELFYIISNGIRFTGMPAWGGLHSNTENWQLVAFIRRLPSLTEEDLQQMREQAGEERHQESGQHHHGSETPPHTD